MQNKVNANRVPCDYKKLKAALGEKGITPYEASNKLGYGSTLLTHTNTTKYLRKPIAIQLEMMFGIKPESYAPDLEQPKPDPQSSPRLYSAFRTNYRLTRPAKASWSCGMW